jgi:hypothetical protein
VRDLEDRGRQPGRSSKQMNGCGAAVSVVPRTTEIARGRTKAASASSAAKPKKKKAPTPLAVPPAVAAAGTGTGARIGSVCGATDGARRPTAGRAAEPVVMVEGVWSECAEYGARRPAPVHTSRGARVGWTWGHVRCVRETGRGDACRVVPGAAGCVGAAGAAVSPVRDEALGEAALGACAAGGAAVAAPTVAAGCWVCVAGRDG